MTELLLALLLESSHRAELLDGVQTIASPGVPGNVVVLDEPAFPVVASGPNAIVAATSFGRGRAVAFSHSGFLATDAWDVADTERLIANSLRWASQNSNPVVGIVGDLGLEQGLESIGFESAHINTHQLQDVDIVVMHAPDLTPVQIDHLIDYVQEGGGLLCGIPGWGWQQLRGDAPLVEMDLNAVLSPMGLAMGGEFAVDTAPGGFDADRAPDPGLVVGRSLRNLLAREEITPVAVQATISSVPAVPDAHPELGALFDQVRSVGAISDLPINSGRPLERVALAITTRDAIEGRLQAKHPTADTFPGAIGPQAPRIPRAITLDRTRWGWQSTGLYAVPGEDLTVRLPDDLVDKGLFLRVGAHTDRLWGKDVWHRAPEVAMAFELADATTRVTSPFGGLIYVDVPRAALGLTGAVEVLGAVEAPLFRQGVTSALEWQRLRDAPAPWAEIDCGDVIVTVPSSAIRDLEDPSRVAAFWQEVMAAIHDLAQEPSVRTRPERMVADVQISAGYMHAGYPIMTHLDVQDLVVSEERLRSEGSWGHFHELGHNFQKSDWTFEGTVEVTVNLFSMYVYQEVLGWEFDQGHPAIRDRDERLQRVRDFIDNGAPFDRWKREPFLALTMYIQMIEAFGWDSIRSVFEKYHRIEPDTRPATDLERRDLWMTMMSAEVRRDLGPFFELWGIPVSAGAREDLSHLPMWMPEELSG